MKRMLLLCTALVCLFCFSASAEVIDIANLSFDEMVALKEKLNYAIWESNEWSKVIVPDGVYKVGVDIPVGTWIVEEASENNEFYQYGTRVEIGKQLNEWGTDLETYSQRYTLSHNSAISTVITLHEGEWVYVNGSAAFITYTGKKDLGFKF